MNKGGKRTQTVSSTKSTAPKLRSGIGRPKVELPKPFHPTRKKNWSDKQWQQSQKFWAKKNKRVESHARSVHQKTINSEDRFIAGQRAVRGAELKKISDMKLVSQARQDKMPNTTTPVAPSPGATKDYKEVVGHIGDFLKPGTPVRSTFNEGGAQLIQQFKNQEGKDVTRRVGVDVEDSSHVRKLKPHLNLQTQIGGKVQQDEPLKDPHHPVRSFDPFAGPRNHPLKGKLTSDERRAFMERYVRSLGTPVEREK